MNKIVVHRPGGFARLELESHESPRPAAGEIRVRTRAIGVNYADCIVRMGLYKSARELVGWPITPGFEFSGIVDEVGAGVGEFRPGDAVFGVSLFGAYASELVVQRAFVRKLPPELDFTQGATFPVAYLTAWYALRRLAEVKRDQHILVHSAAGGVGSALCELGRAEGARVLGVVGATHKVEVAKQRGATEVVDKSQQDLWRAARAFAPRGFDAIFDANGAETLRHSYKHLAPMGRLVIYGFHSMMSHGGVPNVLRLVVQYLRTPRFNPLDMVDRNVSVLGFNLSYLFEQLTLFQVAMDDLMQKLAAGAVSPLPTEVYPLSAAGEAHRILQSGRTTGKLALVPDSE